MATETHAEPRDAQAFTAEMVDALLCDLAQVEAGVEWLRGAGSDPFSELVVPATTIRLAQWVGRAIRTEEDHAHVHCHDKRLVRTGRPRAARCAWTTCRPAIGRS
ncbi:hypothetical protein SDC9_190935 [bioreactor metagenome]|uniref:ATP-dependent helicase C-terminal domain-containing protein n=1 Tax=bioreactor metagenome TaxID=1076179 RepID=A0A645HXP4_9ZZZZ